MFENAQKIKNGDFLNKIYSQTLIFDITAINHVKVFNRGFLLTYNDYKEYFKVINNNVMEVHETVLVKLRLLMQDKEKVQRLDGSGSSVESPQ